ncbi:MAG: hypothetical protein AAF682_19740 [Planctomycetota bacterium]
MTWALQQVVEDTNRLRREERLTLACFRDGVSVTDSQSLRAGLVDLDAAREVGDSAAEELALDDLRTVAARGTPAT